MRRPRRRFSRLTLLLCAFLGVAGAEPSRAGDGRWTPVGPGGGLVWSLAIDPSSPGTLWAGAENGVYKSTDGGATWTRKAGGNSPYSSVAVDPDHPSTVYAGVGKILRSDDGGETWSVALDSDASVYSLAVVPGSGTVYATVNGVMRSTDGGRSWKKVLDHGARQIVFEPSNPGTVYALGNPGIWKSTDGGDNWARMGPPLAGSVDLAFLQSIAVAPSQPGTLYVGSSSAGTGYVYRSTDGGASWTRGGTLALWTVQALIVDPQTPTTVYASGGYGLVVSTDGGEHWVEKKSGLSGDFALTLVFAPGTPRILYAGLRSFGVAQTQDGGEHWRIGLQLGLSAGGRLMEVDPVRAGTFYVSAAGRTFRTTDGGQTWTPFADGLSNIGYVDDLVVDRFHPATIYAGTSYGIFRSTDDGASWTEIDLPSSTLGLADGGNVILSAYSCGLRRSADGGRTWRDVLSCHAEDDLSVYPRKLLALPGRPTVHAVVHVGDYIAHNRWYLYTSRSNGRFWSRGIEALDVAVCLAYPATVYTANVDGLRRSDDGGRHWTSPLDAGMRPSYVAADPRNPRIVYAGGPTVRRSTDGGLTWSDAGEGLGGRLRNAAKLFADPTTPGHFFVEDSTTGGLFEATFPSP